MQREDLPYTLDECDDAGRLVRVRGRADDWEVACAMFEAACKAMPNAYFCLSHKAQINKTRKSTPWKPEPYSP